MIVAITIIIVYINVMIILLFNVVHPLYFIRYSALFVFFARLSTKPQVVQNLRTRIKIANLCARNYVSFNSR